MLNSQYLGVGGRRIKSSRLSLATYQDWGQPGLQEILPQKKRRKVNEKCGNYYFAFLQISLVSGFIKNSWILQSVIRSDFCWTYVKKIWCFTDVGWEDGRAFPKSHMLSFAVAPKGSEWHFPPPQLQWGCALAGGMFSCAIIENWDWPCSPNGSHNTPPTSGNSFPAHLSNGDTLCYLLSLEYGGTSGHINRSVSMHCLLEPGHIFLF